MMSYFLEVIVIRTVKVGEPSVIIETWWEPAYDKPQEGLCNYPKV